MNTEKKTKISLQTKIHIDDKPEIFELIVFGEVIQKKNTIYFRYTEQTPEGEIKNLVKFDGKDVSVIRSGSVKMRQRFVKGLETSCLLESPMGNIHLTMKTTAIRFTVKEFEGVYTLKFVYNLSAQFKQIGMYEITLTANELRANNL